MRRKGLFLLIVLMIMLIGVTNVFGQATKPQDTQTVGPQGEKPTWYSDLKLTDAEKETIRKGHYKAAYLLHTTSDFTNALLAGAKAAFKIGIICGNDRCGDGPQRAKDRCETRLH